MTLLRLLAGDLGVPCPSARDFALQLLVATIGLLALGGIYVIGWAVAS